MTQMIAKTETVKEELKELRVDVITNTERLVCQFSGFHRAEMFPQAHSPGDAGCTLLIHTHRLRLRKKSII